MAGLLEGAFGGLVRREMKSRVDEVLAAGREWNEAAKKLTQALETIAKLAAEGKTDPVTTSQLTQAAKILSRPTIRLGKAFERYIKTLEKICTRL